MIAQSLKKEVKLLLKDVHSIAVLLVMPVAFMLIMTFAMSESQSDIMDSIDVGLVSEETSKAQDVYIQYLHAQGVHTQEGPGQVTLNFAKDFSNQLLSGEQSKLEVHFSPQLSPQLQAIMSQHIQMAFAKLKLHLYLLEEGRLDPELSLAEQMKVVEQQTSSKRQIQFEGGQRQAASTEYSIPSWLVFGVYSIVLPISITLLNEIKNGTLIRLKTFPVHLNHYFAIKLISFYLISLIQFMLLSLIGLFVVPLIVSLPSYSVSAVWHLIPTMFATCLAAVSFAAIIATQVRSYEQAIVIGGGVNIILAALSGFMVPFDMMPKAMQVLAQYSPMYWSAASVKAVMLQGEAVQAANYLIQLLLFSAACLSLAMFLFTRKTRSLSWS